ncbi:Protein of unknwon function (DUF3310) [Schinkia azotoformans MEV2011]|uniref:Protein of unknwon function (DUF3310) n=1 Tax=Schinkia azotoformans MEV2011 TaxID=1348973 RepID=A0A072NU77_SCHAZ|nr:DUF3310 domain-containing protein [Schinkia azotoformans]KEF40433.1 Protein of unknwon function (DUF3310) [Schinkia azotoformans MEV2011]MEC1696157.1 DUF3310 domain-containing protein [Schinkia azotoformans]MEC1725340.1 DUF3310 domain-containing protein [Schinkia azotoformans]MEC1779451.1 DUF3310 domain-containing protein [Schinkia azotoformans]MED4330064.1 DUF3310 domain-containing protein [Schinkia azotoformans]
MKFGNGDINFGEKSSVTWDTSVKTTKLSPEQMKRLQGGQKLEDILTGNEEVKVEKQEKIKSHHPWRDLQTKESEAARVEKEKLTVEKYKAMKAKGMADAQIKEELRIGTNTLNDFKKKHGLHGTRGQHLRKKNVPVPEAVVTDRAESVLESNQNVTESPENDIKTRESVHGGALVIEQTPDSVEIEDVINSPVHYTDGGIETIDYIEAKLTGSQFEGYLACRKRD